MKYTIIQGKETEVVLKRSRTLEKVISILLIIAGIPMILIGALLFLAMTGGIHAPFMFTGGGILLASASLMLLTQVRAPDFLVFDNARGWLQVREKKGGGFIDAAIPYRDIDGFRVIPHKGNQRRYSAVMAKKDGATWVLLVTGNSGKAGALSAALAEKVRLDADGGALPADSKVEGIRVESGADSDRVLWKTQNAFAGTVMTLLVIASFGMILFGAWPVVTNIIAYVAAVIFICAIGLMALYHVVSSIGRTYQLEITATEIRYGTRGGIISARGFTVPVHEIRGVIFNFSVSAGETAIYFLRKEEIDIFQKIALGSLGPHEILNAAFTVLKAKKIVPGNITVPEKVRIEQLVQTLIRKRSGVTGL